jgi:excisionase family DNA binding protein
MYQPGQAKPIRYSPKQVGQMLSVETSTVYAWISRGELNALRVGRRRFISPQELRRFLDSRKTHEHIDYTYAKRS